MSSNVLHMSLSDLLKKSAMQICYLRKNQEKTPPVTKEQIEGNIAAHEKTLDKRYVEMRGTYELHITDKKILIHYAFDEIQPTDVACLLIEHKNIKSGSTVELWYRNSSILQTAAYQAFAKVNPDKKLETATFHVKDGNPKVEFELGNQYIRSELHFGPLVYTVIATEPDELVNFFCQKAIASLDYDSARMWDKRYKFKEFDNLHTHLTYRILKDNESIKIK